jgi:hypothetical protein
MVDFLNAVLRPQIYLRVHRHGFAVARQPRRRSVRQTPRDALAKTYKPLVVRCFSAHCSPLFRCSITEANRWFFSPAFSSPETLQLSAHESIEQDFRDSFVSRFRTYAKRDVAGPKSAGISSPLNLVH